MPDRYSSFAELWNGETEGVDFRIWLQARESAVAIIAPHGGCIEPGTSEIAAAIAADTHSLYCFEGLRKGPLRHLHIRSTRFDEPRCLDLIGRSIIVVAVHGLAGKQNRIDIGGRDTSLRDAICTSLKTAGFACKVVTQGGHAAISPYNICNRGHGSAGVQLEITRGLRNTLLNGGEDLGVFARGIRGAIGSRLTV